MDVEHVSNFVRVIHKADVVTTLDEVDGMDIDQSDPMQLHHDNQHQICYFQIVGQAFLWHQIRCIVEVLFYIGRELEPPSVITDLLDVDKNPRKPSYPYADEKPLVLHHCGFMNLQFGYSVSNIWTVMCQLEHQWEELSLAAARIRNCINTLYDVSIKKEDLISFCESNKKKLGCYSTSSLRSIVSDLTADGDDGTSTVQWKFALECILRHFNTVPDPQGLNSSVHIPLLQRSKGTSYEEKVVALQGNSKRKMKYEENIVQKKQPEEVDKEFYERKQKQGGQGL
jgi:tRNA pseudouridine38/39 synthase